MTNAEVLYQVEHGYRMQSPEGCEPALYDIMLECWHKVNLKLPTKNVSKRSHILFRTQQRGLRLKLFNGSWRIS